MLLLLRGASPQPQWGKGLYESERVLRARPSAWCFQGLLAWFRRVLQSVASAHRRLNEVNSTSQRIEIWHGAASFPPRFRTHTRVLNLESHMTVALLEIMPGQVPDAIPVLLRKTAEPPCSGMDSGKRCQSLVRTLEPPPFNIS